MREQSPRVVDAVQHVRRLRGGAQSHLMRTTGGEWAFHVVKFSNNPQHPRILANEFLASRLGQEIGLPMATPAIVTVNRWLIDNTPELRFESAGCSVPVQPGECYGSQYAGNPETDMVVDYLPESLQARVLNGNSFAGILALDKWLANADGRQCVFVKNHSAKHFSVTFIDHGYSLNAGEWNFPDLALHGVYFRNYVYQHVTGWESFEPWLSRIESFKRADLRAIAAEIPATWIDDRSTFERVIDELARRTRKVRDLLTAFKDSSRNPFPNWKETN